MVLPVPERPKKDRRALVIHITTRVGRTMHGHDSLHGQQVVHDGEYGFLDFTGIRRVADNAEPLIEIQNNKGFRSGGIDGLQSL